MRLAWIRAKSSPVKISDEHRRRLWRLDCETVARGVSIGLFIAMLPIPLQMVSAALLAIAFRGNLPIAVGLTWINNTITFVPITYLTYFLGYLIIGDGTEIHPEIFKIDWTNLGSIWSSFNGWLSHFGRAYFVGLPIVAFGAAVGGYLLVRIAWHSRQLARKIISRYV